MRFDALLDALSDASLGPVSFGLTWLGTYLVHGTLLLVFGLLLAKRIRSNVRELEGALRRVIANSRFTGRPITLDFAKEALRDLLALQERLRS